MIIKDLYSHRITAREENRIGASILINARHDLFLGHFPGFAVTPGVCQILMVREILEDELKIPLMLTAAKQIKFTAVHEPGIEPEIQASITYSIKDEQLDVNARLSSNEKVFLKFRGEFKEQR